MAAGIAEHKHLLLFDSTCDICRDGMSMVTRRDPTGIFRLETLQSDFAKSAVARYGINPATSDSAIILANWKSDKEELLRYSAAVHFVARQLGIGRRLVALLDYVPRFVLDWIYIQMARNRRRFRRKRGTCEVPRGD